MPSEPDEGPARHLEGGVERLKACLESPQKLLQLVAATAAADAGPLYRQSVEARLQEEDLVTFVRLLAHVGLATRQVRDEAQAADLAVFFRQRLRGLPADLVVALERTLAQLPVPSSAESPMPVQLATRLSLQLTREAYERGEVSSTGVYSLLGRLTGEVATLRRVLGVPAADDYAGLLEEEFWSTLPELERQRVLTSSDAWCVPPGALRRHLESGLQQPEAARTILEQYAYCAHHPSEAARARAALGMTELADLYAHFGGPLLESAISHAGRQLIQEFRSDMQSLLSTAFDRLSQQAVGRRGFRALQQAVKLLDTIERTGPRREDGLRSRVAVESHLGEFIREAVGAPGDSRDLAGLLRQVPQAAAEMLVEEFESRTQRGERNRVVDLAAGLGPVGRNHLREKLRTQPPGAAVLTVGLLSRLEPASVLELLPARLRRWDRAYHDAVVRLVAAGGAPERGGLLLHLLEFLDPLVLPGALDEVGLSGDPKTAPRLMRLAGGTLPQSSEPYLRLKAVEALGRLREPTAAPLMRQLVEATGVWRWREPREIRIAAAQALRKIDPEWAQKSLRRSGLSAAELAVVPSEPEPATPWVRQRRYLRVSLASKLPTLARTVRGQWSLATQVLSLGGGLGVSGESPEAGTEVDMELHFGLRSLRATALVRDPRPPFVGFEIVRMELDERSKLRRLLVPCWEAQARAAAPSA